MDEQHSEIGVSAFTDPAQSAPAPTGVLPRRQAQIAGKVTAGRKAIDIAHEADKRRGSEQPDARNSAQPFDHRGLRGKRLQLLLDGRLSIKLCLRSCRHPLEPSLKHRIELMENRKDAVIGDSPFAVLER